MDGCTDHACARVLPDEGVSEDLCEFTGSERGVGLVEAQRPDALLMDGQGERERERERQRERQRSASYHPGDELPTNDKKSKQTPTRHKRKDAPPCVP